MTAIDLPVQEYIKLKAKLEALVKSERGKTPYEWPRVSFLARRMRITIDDVQQLVSDSEDLDLVVGIGLPNMGGISEFGSPGQYLVEWIGEE